MAWLTRVESHSMAPALRDGVLALTLRLGHRAHLRRGDIVVAESRELGRRIVKRIVGLPGETVAFEAGQVHIDGQPLAEPYASRSVFSDLFHVPPGHYLLLGDQRDASSDSRSWRQPYIARAAIVGRVVGRGWLPPWRARQRDRAAEAHRPRGPGPVRAGAVFHAVRHLRKPMDLSSWLGANRSDTRRYHEDLQRRQGGKDAVLCAA
ncbi:MAG TPA: signal peptidase I [Rubrivivax sp.]|nr:signal peptidase I [Rubrivivax sp.]